MLRNRSRLPCTPSQPFEAKSESPIAATRVSGFGASAAGVFASRPAWVRPRLPAAFGAATDTAAASDTGPCDVLVLVEPDRLLREEVGDVRLAPALRRALDEGLRRPAVRAALNRLDGPGERVGRDHAEPVHDRVRRVAHGDRGHLVGAEQLADAARVDDDVVPGLDPPLLQQRDEVR